MPSLRARHATFDVRTAVLDYFPKVTIAFPDIEEKEKVVQKQVDMLSSSSGLKQGLNIDPLVLLAEDFGALKPRLVAGRDCHIIVVFSNRSFHSASLALDTSVNEEDEYSTASVKVPQQTWEIDPADIHIKDPKREQTKQDSDKEGRWSVNGRDVKIVFVVKPDLKTNKRDIEFSVKVKFETKMSVMTEDGKQKGGLRAIMMEFVLDFNLGPSQTPRDAALQVNQNVSDEDEQKMEPSPSFDMSGEDKSGGEDLEALDGGDEESEAAPHHRANKARNSGEFTLGS